MKRKKKVIQSKEPTEGLITDFKNFEKKPFPAIDVDRMVWWRKERESLPELFKVAQEVMSIACSSSKSERVFSQVSLNDTSKRRRLDPYKLEELVLISDNKQDQRSQKLTLGTKM